MALIQCPECGKDGVSDSAVSCPNCGYNVQAHMKKLRQQEKILERNRQIQQQEQIKENERIKRMNDSAYRKKQIKVVSAIIILIAVIICAVVFGIKYKTTKAYEKDLSSVFGITTDMGIEDIIEFEVSRYGHTEYNIEKVQDGKITRVEFAPYERSSLETDYKHYYFFYTDSGLLKEITYFDISAIGNKDDAAKCEHISKIKQAALNLSPDWDKSERDGLFLYMYGNIDGIDCRIKYQAGSSEAISLFIDREE